MYNLDLGISICCVFTCSYLAAAVTLFSNHGATDNENRDEVSVPIGESSGFWPDADFMFRLRQKNEQFGQPTGTGPQQVTDGGAPCPTQRPPEQKVIFIHRVGSSDYRPDMTTNQTTTQSPAPFTVPQISITSAGPPLDAATAERLQSVLTSLYRLSGWMNYETALEREMKRRTLKR